MQAVLLRVGLDTGVGQTNGPLFKNGSFEFVPIPDQFKKKGANCQTYGNTAGRYGRKLLEYFPERLHEKCRDISIHNDPEFETFTYGDPTPPKASLRRLRKGDLLIFYAGLHGWNFESAPALYIVGYFEVEKAGKAADYSLAELKRDFRRNFHVRHKSVFDDQRNRLVLVKGNEKSRLLQKARLMSAMGTDRNGRPLKVLSAEMQRIFGDFGGHLSFQRSPPRWVSPEFVAKAAQFVRSL